MQLKKTRTLIGDKLKVLRTDFLAFLGMETLQGYKNGRRKLSNNTRHGESISPIFKNTKRKER